MTFNPDSLGFRMTEPAEHVSPTQYAFWLETDDANLFSVAQRLLCVERVKMSNDTKGLVSIKDRFDADEAWHYIRIKLHQESNMIQLDPMWEDAMKWL